MKKWKPVVVIELTHRFWLAIELFAAVKTTEVGTDRKGALNVTANSVVTVGPGLGDGLMIVPLIKPDESLEPATIVGELNAVEGVPTSAIVGAEPVSVGRRSLGAFNV